MGLVESRLRRPSLKEITGLGLFFGLRPMKEHAIMHRDLCCSLLVSLFSSLLKVFKRV